MYGRYHTGALDRPWRTTLTLFNSSLLQAVSSAQFGTTVGQLALYGHTIRSFMTAISAHGS